MPHWIQQVDDGVLRWFQENHTRFLDYNLQNITALGSTTVLAIFSVFFLGLLFLDGQYKKAVLAALVVVAVHLATEEIKSRVGRPRPVLGRPVRTAQSDSFPSSHSSRAMTVYPVFALAMIPAGKRARSYALAAAFLLAVVVGVTRLYFGNHFLSDVLGGWLLGLFFVFVYYGANRLSVQHSRV
jgi:undecaprenyl-diphosphatase